MSAERHPHSRLTGRYVLFVNLRRIPREGFEALIAARRLGLHVVLLGHELPDFARGLVHTFCEVDTADVETSLGKALELVAAHDIAGVASFTEADVPLVAAIAHAAGLVGLPPAAAVRARDKYVMKEALTGLGVLPRFARVRGIRELREAMGIVGFPAVIKPTGGVGSKGIFELRTEADLEPAMAHLERIVRPEFDAVFRGFERECIVEEYADGDELSVEGFVAGGEIHVIAVTDKLTTEPFHLELQHVVPSRLPADVVHAVAWHARRIVERLELDHCAFHLEGKWGARGFRFIEVAARPAGDYITARLVPLATGVDFFENTIRLALGSPLRLARDRSLHAGIRFILAERTGRFAGLAGLREVLETPGYRDVALEVPLGTKVILPPEHFGMQRVAAITACHAGGERLAGLLAAVATGVRADVVDHGEPEPAAAALATVRA
jgi:biotin carboxylase